MSESSKSETSLPSSSSTDIIINDSTLKNAAKEDIRSLLLDRINPDFGLLDVLLRNGALDRTDCQAVKSQQTPYDRNVRLLEIVTRKGKLREFFEALIESRQEHLVNYVTANGERSSQRSRTWPLTSREISILNANQECLVKNMDVSNTELVIKLYEIGFLTIRQKDHVCELVLSYQKVETLLDILYRSSLNNYYKMISCLLDTKQPRIVKILKGGGKVPRIDLGEELLAFRKEIELKEEEEEGKEVEEEEEEAKKQMTEHSSKVEHESLEEVEEIVKKTRELRTSTFIRTEFEILAAILRNNFDYFVEFLVPKALIDRLHAEECLSDEETMYIKTLTSDRDKSHEIMKAIHGFPSKYNVFVDILREKEQYRVAEVAERGGAVMKVSITFRKQTNSADIQQKLYDRIQSLLSKTSLFSIDVVQVVSLLAKAGVEIIEAKNSRHLSLWLWCRSEFTLQKFNEMSESSSEELIRFFSELFALFDINDQIPPIMNIDLDDPDRCVVSRQSGYAPVAKLAVGQHSVCAVTSHENNVYALTRNPTAILVFPVDNTSSIRLETTVPDIKDPVNMAFINEFVFVSDSGNSCIWQIKVMPFQARSWSVRAPFTMSVLHGCNILKASYGQPSTLNIYNTDFKQVKEISLPLSIQVPCHAVGTLANTFIVSYKEKASPSGGLCEVNSSGDLLSIFDMRMQPVQGVVPSVNQSLFSLIGSEVLKGYPEHFTLNERGEIFAADRSKGGILVYNPRLMLDDILEEDSIKRSSGIHYAVNSKLLLVVVDGEGDKSEVVVLKQKRAL